MNLFLMNAQSKVSIFVFFMCEACTVGPKLQKTEDNIFWYMLLVSEIKRVTIAEITVSSGYLVLIHTLPELAKSVCKQKALSLISVRHVFTPNLSTMASWSVAFSFEL